MPNNILAMMIFIPLIIFFTLFIIDSLIPFYVLVSLNNICDEYNQILIKDGVLTASETSELRGKLESKGLKNIVMSLPTTTEWGDSFTIDISGNFTLEVITISLKKTTKTHNFSYKKRGLSIRGSD